MENSNEVLPPPQPGQPPQQTKKWYQHKGVISVVVLALLAAAVVWIYFANQPTQNVSPIVLQHKAKQIQQTATSTPLQTDISSWQTYTDTQAAFSFQYPNGWSVQFTKDTMLPGLMSDKEFNAPDGFSVDVAILSNNQNLALTDFYKQVLMGHEFSSDPGSGYDPSIDKIENITVAGQPALKITTDIYDNMMVRVLVPANNVVVRFAITYQTDSDWQNLNQILSTFQILPQASTASNQSGTGTSGNQVVNGDQYGLFQATYNQVDITQVQYQDDGVISSGKYSGYHRVVASVEFDEPGGPTIYFFATKDYQTFVADTSAADDYNTANSLFNKTKVIGLGNVANYTPDTIVLGNFVLVLGNADLSPSLGVELPSTIPGFKLYGDSYVDNYYTTSTSPVTNYIAGNSDVYAVDENGLAFNYAFTSAEANSSKNNDNSFYTASDLSSTAPLYSEYGELIPGGCGNLGTTYQLQNISLSDLIQVATTLRGVKLYTLKDANHSLNQAEYAAKVSGLGSSFVDINNTPAPSYQQYMAKNPVLIFQDPLGRWIGLGEFQYQNDEGCGKPVIYLYPPKPTEVTVKFLNQMNFNVDIPTYAGQWDVLASPDGELKDLQPQVTDCSKINYSFIGSEYAYDACQKGIYPYLYWEGQTSGAYPKADEGWIVNKNNLSTFLNSKLAEIGLNEKEKSNMLSYWLPQLLSKNAPYYRLSFFQTQTMDKFIPMQVTPKPDTTLRIFLDWSPLANLPSTPLKPEVLNYIDRKGFTLVEWGGLKQ